MNQKRLGLSVFIVCYLVFFASTALANQAFFTVNLDVRPGMLVSLTRNPEVVEPSTEKMDTALVGVVSNGDSSGIVEQGQVTVLSEGIANVLVSTVAGDIKVGDRIGVSSIVGIGAKSGSSGWIVGTAQRDVNEQSEEAVPTEVLDSSGVKRTVYIASIPVQLKVVYFSSPTPPSQKSTAIPYDIQTVADSVAGKRASTAAIIMSFILILCGVAVAGFIVVTAVRKGLEGIARQPLVKRAMTKGMLQSFLVALAIILSVNVGALVILRIL